MVEQWTENPCVAGSIPALSTQRFFSASRGSSARSSRHGNARPPRESDHGVSRRGFRLRRPAAGIREGHSRVQRQARARHVGGPGGR